MKNPPILISVIGFFAAMAGFAWLFLGFRLLGFDWFGLLGDVQAFEQAGLWGWLAIVGGVLWLAAAFGLWSMQPWAWMLDDDRRRHRPVRGVLWISSSTRAAASASACRCMPILIILYLNSRDVKAQFGVSAAPEA